LESSLLRDAETAQAITRTCQYLNNRAPIRFLNAYQELVLAEPDSALRSPLKEAFLTLRRAAESSYEDS
jgi:hypothetical protein